MGRVRAHGAGRTTPSVSLANARSLRTRYILKGQSKGVLCSCSTLTNGSYVEMLESQQTQLVAGLQELYRRLQSGEGWTGPALRESSRGTPLTHDILERLGALKPDPKTGVDHFEENYDVLQNILFANGAGPLQREPSFDTSSEAGQSPTCEIVSQSRIPSYSNSFSAMQFPPTPPIGSPHQFPSKSNSSLKVEMPLPNHSPWQADSTEYSEMDYNMTYETALSDAPMQATTFTNQVYNGLDTMSINPCLTMKQWPTTDDQFQRYIHSTFT